MTIIVSRGGKHGVIDIELSLTSIPRIKTMINVHYCINVVKDWNKDVSVTYVYVFSLMCAN